jgi:FdhD protein
MARRPGDRRARPENRVRVVRVRDGDVAAGRDVVAGEEPLEIRLLAGGRRETVAITMRTPGDDFALAAGFLFGEGVISSREEIAGIRYCTDVDEAQRYNVVNVRLRSDRLPDLERLERHFLISSACGVCGKAHLDALAVRCDGPLPHGPRMSVDALLALPGALRAGQELFASTGGLHAAGLFAPDGRLIALREDVGRHNAMDKLVGWALLEGRPTEAGVVCVSGRASYELLQKAVAARMSFFAAVSAPSSLAVDLARRFGVTLVGFLRDGAFNVYAGAGRIDGLPVGG